jgi:hypothetical protein
MPFSMRVGKGVRISASPRGLRAHVGPRQARVHFGSGRPGVSTGAGPLTYYTSGGGQRVRSTSSRAAGPSKTQLAQQQKEQEFHRLHAIFASILEIHRAEFPKAQRPVAPPPDQVDEKGLLDSRMKEQLNGLSVWKMSDRKAAKARARVLADEDARAEWERRDLEAKARQQELDEAWDRLRANDPATVIDAVDDAFEDNEAPAVPVDMEGSTLSLVMLAPTADEIPEQKPSVTPSGKASVKKLTKTEAADAYVTLISGHLLATIKEALSVAPGVSDVKAVVVRRTDKDVFGETHLEALLAGRFSREDLGRVRWNEALSPQIVQQAAKELRWELKGRPPVLKPLGLDEEPELKAFIDALEERADRGG